MFLSMVVAMGACTKSSTPDSGGSNSITAFSFQTTGNQIPVSSQASIQGSNIALFLPPGTNTGALVATFSVSGNATVSVNGVTQTSGVTPNDFTSPVTYTVTTTGGKPQTYSVSVTTGISAIDQNVTAFMTQYNIPGMAIAITLNDRLVYTVPRHIIRSKIIGFDFSFQGTGSIDYVSLSNGKVNYRDDFNGVVAPASFSSPQDK